jgi:hypothetical protein
MKLQAAISLDLIRNPILSFFIQLTHADMDVIFPIIKLNLRCILSIGCMLIWRKILIKVLFVISNI